jgi:hypothetical protein
MLAIKAEWSPLEHLRQEKNDRDPVTAKLFFYELARKKIILPCRSVF